LAAFKQIIVAEFKLKYFIHWTTGNWHQCWKRQTNTEVLRIRNCSAYSQTVRRHIKNSTCQSMHIYLKN